MSEKIVEILQRADREPGFRGALIWFPEDVCAKYDLTAGEASAIRTGDFTMISLAEEVRDLATKVYDLHDMHSGE